MKEYNNYTYNTYLRFPISPSTKKTFKIIFIFLKTIITIIYTQIDNFILY